MGKKIILFGFILGFLAFKPEMSYAQDDIFNSSGLKIPRFVTLRSDKVFVRTGPALRYPIKWVFQRENLPVEVIQEFDTWRKIRDHQGEEGWIHQSLTKGARYAVIQIPDKEFDAVTMKRKADESSKSVALFEPDVVVKLEECVPSHCKVSKSGYKGWIERKFLWGIYADEKLD